MFSNSTQNTTGQQPHPQSGIFSTPSNTGLFGASQSQSNPAGPGLFGAPTQPAGAQSQPQPGGGLFGASNPAQPSAGPFNKQSSTTLFGSQTTGPNPGTNALFGAGPRAQPTSTSNPQVGNNLFGTKPQGAPPQGGLFGNSQNAGMSSNPQNQPSNIGQPPQTQPLTQAQPQGQQNAVGGNLLGLGGQHQQPSSLFGGSGAGLFVAPKPQTQEESKANQQAPGILNQQGPGTNINPQASGIGGNQQATGMGFNLGQSNQSQPNFAPLLPNAQNPPNQPSGLFNNQKPPETSQKTEASSLFNNNPLQNAPKIGNTAPTISNPLQVNQQPSQLLGNNASAGGSTTPLFAAQPQKDPATAPSQGLFSNPKPSDPKPPPTQPNPTITITSPQTSQKPSSDQKDAPTGPKPQETPHFTQPQQSAGLFAAGPKPQKPEEKPETKEKPQQPQQTQQTMAGTGGPSPMGGINLQKPKEPDARGEKYPVLDSIKPKPDARVSDASQREGPYITENLLLKSCEQNNQFLLSVLKNETSCGAKEIIGLLDSRQVGEKLEKVLGYYKPSEEDSIFKKFYDEGKVKWNGKEGKKDLNNISRELIAMISDQSNLGIRHSFNLLDFHFRNDQRSFHLIANYQESMPQEQKAQLGRIAERLSHRIKLQISKERVRLLQIVHRLLSLSK